MSSDATDHLLHAIAAHLLLLNSAPPPPPQPQPLSPPAAHHANPYPKPQAYPQPPQPNPSDHGHLLRRMAVLESTLPHCFPSPPGPRPQPNPRPHRTAAHQEPPPSPPPPRRARAGPSSARELAARTIQTHFRCFLARRSRTLRQLKELAILRSKAAALRGSLSGRRGCGDPAAISKAAMGLLLHLDAIQGGDPMIREGKRAVSRELTRILEFLDNVLVKEHEEMAMGGVLNSNEYHEGCNGAFVANPHAVNKKKDAVASAKDSSCLKRHLEEGEFKDMLAESASSELRSSGWVDLVCNFMRSQKRRCVQNTDMPQDSVALRKQLISDSGRIFRPKIPELLREQLIQSLRLYYHDKFSAD